MPGIIPEIANGSLITTINESARQFITTDAGIANAIQIQQAHDTQVLILIILTIMIIQTIVLIKISRRVRK